MFKTSSVRVRCPTRLPTPLTFLARCLHAVSETPSSIIQRKAQLRLAETDRLRPASQPLVDNFNRKHDYLRISLTERCNLRCMYCMPSEGVELSPAENILTDDEILRLSRLFVQSGVTKIRLTGGEPTIRKGLVDLVSRLNELKSQGLQSIAMTSNGIALFRKLPELVKSGLTHLNLSLDTLDPLKFELMTRRQGHEAVLRALELATHLSGIQAVKLNVVILKGVNDREILDFVQLTRDKSISVRFIEFMPFTGNKWNKDKLVSSSDLLSQITSAHVRIRKLSDEVNETARTFQVAGYRGTFGFISSMSDHFCASCNRLRVTADGQIKVCLFDDREVSLRDLMRNGASDNEILQVVRAALGMKKEKHAGMEDIDVLNNRPMILIGGSQKWVRRREPVTVTCATTLSAPFRDKRPQFYRFMSNIARRSVHEEDSGTRLTHIDDDGRPSMVNVSQKESSTRTATAHGRIYIPKIAYDLVVTPPELPKSDFQEKTPANDEINRRRLQARSKGDVLTVAQLAGIMASKRTADLIPLCHTVPLSHISVVLRAEKHADSPTPRENNQIESLKETDKWEYSIGCCATATCDGKTGVEMEALTAVSVSLLTVWDMLKAVAGKEMMIGTIHVTKKSGGKSGDFEREPEGKNGVIQEQRIV